MRRFDPVLGGALLVLACITVWMASPLATGAPSASSDTRINLTVASSTAVTPGWQSGDATIRMPNLSVPGDWHDASSPGWRMSTNWANGYEVRLRATTDPALRGRNAVDGNGARDSFEDFSTSAGCPCAWTGTGADKGLFGYSVAVSNANGLPALEGSKWGTSTSRKWRGFTKSSYRAFSTQGGTGQYAMTLWFRSMIPDSAVQSEGSYRAGVVISVHPLM